MKIISKIFPLFFAFVITYLLNSSLGSVPPMGKLLSPFQGFWQNAERKQTAGLEEELKIPGLQAEVQVLVDEMGIPHIFAQNEHDLYLAQGYLTARDRLWQMEFQTHFAGGRIAELVGEKGLESDKYQRRMGAVYGAEQSLEGMKSDPKAQVAVEAYSEGVNKYIESLSPKDYPLEYKLLNYAPEKWTPLKSALFLKNMSFVLASGTDDLKMTNILRVYGKDVAEDLFPNYPFEESPIIPKGTAWDFKPLQTPEGPKDFVGLGSAINQAEKDPNLGSNNWAVAGSKTFSGMPILANDPHLTLSLPSIWYQIQLHAPGVNVYGATMPGAPHVIAGFNSNIAWGVTNVGSDVLDWYQVKFKDASKKEYFHDGKWKKTTLRIEKYKIKGGKEVVDSIYFTHHGPVVYLTNDKPFKSNIPVGHALRWTALEKSKEVSMFYNLNRAKNYDEYVDALKDMSAPAQNFVFASNEGDIALWVNGKFPLKSHLQGKYLLDGTDAKADWVGYIPQNQNPHVKNPSRQFVSSANQFSTDPSYPYYLGWQFSPSERGRRINERLEVMQKITIDSLRNLQNDNFNMRARRWIPILLTHLDVEKVQNKKALELLKKWNLVNDPHQIAPTIFDKWIDVLMDTIWNDEFAADEHIPMNQPSIDRTLLMFLQTPGAKWFDNIKTKQIETINEDVTAAFNQGMKDLQDKNGALGENWEWYKAKETGVRHLIPGMDALSRLKIPIGGGSGIVNASSTKSGPSWRLVVELSKKGNPKAYGVYPGGQSGNPGSSHYDDLIDTWAKGELKELLFLKDVNQNSNRIKKKLFLLK
ncbi:penicillin acylase family protein [Sandaracinomonas limnophila]|uniref:Penicillin acylase family protein n=2 Tax=Sandaracinomonas limnophila TaxID=1862386 RepID=A0A437PTD3_9BACT|nr:penicillin acylase family protein [Sandaracinomonas limnophila]